MSIKIILCIKPVPASDKATIDPVTKMVRRDTENVISSLDRNALAAAAAIKKVLDCEITVITMAPPSAEINLREALALAADRAVLISDRAFAGGDTFATSYVLARAIEKLGGADLILAGAHSDDGGTAQVPAQLAEWLKIPHLHYACEIIAGETGLSVKTVADKGFSLYEAAYPVLISVDRSINRPRPAGMREILAAKKKEIVTWSLDNLPDIDQDFLGLSGSPTQFGDMYEMKHESKCEIIKGDKESVVKSIIEKLASAGAFI